MKRIFISLLLTVSMLLGLGLQPVMAAGTGRLVVSDAEGMAGETISVDVMIENNPGIISVAMQVFYDTDKLELICVDDKKIMPDSMFSQDYSSYPYYASWVDAVGSGNTYDNGILMTMTFRILEDCAPGETEISLQINPGDLFDWDMETKQFVTVGGTVTIETAAEDEGENGEPESDSVASDMYSRFTDLQSSGWYRTYVEFMLSKGYMNGVGATRFDPDGSVTRAQLVTILYRIAGSPSVNGLTNQFEDVSYGTWYTDAVIWAAANGIVTGITKDTFAPNNNITREQLATILYRYNGTKKELTNHLKQFEDSGSVSAYAADAMNWAVGAGIINGSGAQLMPSASATRVQTAAMLTRYVESFVVIPLPTEPTEKN